ncbi:fatty acid-binding protein, adipocyte-like [Mytilus edulis]|uniref:fatty acid-binding protein, adipocyte-like n=1 Tax=Mytilus edulis TaxID=6550 RepID=UPI0039EFE954
MATDEMKSKFEGKWKLYKNDNIDAFFSDVGVNFLVRKMIAAGSPTQTITINDDSVKIDVDAGFRKREDVVKLNVEEDKTTENGEPGKMMATYEDGKIKFVQTPNDPKSTVTTMIREREGEELVLVMIRHKNPEIVAKRWFKRL